MFSDLVIFRSNLAHKIADRLQPVHRADAPKFKVFKKEFMNTYRYINRCLTQFNIFENARIRQIIRKLFDFIDKLEQPSRGHFRYRNRVGRFGHCSDVHDKVRNENKRKIDKSYKIILYNCLYI